MYLRDNFDIEYGVTDEEMEKACQDKNFRKNFKLFAAQEIAKFSADLEGPRSQVQNYSTFETVQPMINLDLNKGKQPFNCSNMMIPPSISHQESTTEILQSTFEHININPLFDEKQGSS